MKRLNLKSFVKHLSMAVLGTVIAIGFINTPKMTVKAQTFSNDYCSYDSNEQRLTLTGIVVNVVDAKDGGIVLPDGVNKTDVKRILATDEAVLPENSKDLFEGFSNLLAASLKKADTSNVKNMGYMFNDCTNLAEVELPIDTTEVKVMSGMFMNCSSLTLLDISSFTVSQIIDETPEGESLKSDNMQEMFSGCTSLQTIVVNTSWVLDESVAGTNMFYNCVSLCGGNGTVFNSTKLDADYAKIDTSSTKGYLSTSTSLILYGQLKTSGNKYILDLSFTNKTYGERTYSIEYNGKTIDQVTLPYNQTEHFEINAVAKEMNTAKTLKITSGEEVLINKSISIADYLRNIVDIYETSNPTVSKVAGAMLRYGAASQLFFDPSTPEAQLANYNVWGYEDFKYNITPPGAGLYPIDATAINADLATYGASYYGFNLSLDEEITFMMAFKLPDNATGDNWSTWIANNPGFITAINKYYCSRDLNASDFVLDGSKKYAIYMKTVEIKK